MEEEIRICQHTQNLYMTRLKKLFENKQNNILNIYCTAGYPTLNDTKEIMLLLQNNGVDIIELGIPYSDPLADGLIIQQSSSVALNNGMSIEILFNQLENFRNQIHIPVMLMGYLNPILQYGFEAFCSQANKVGIDGLIIPDLPMIEFEEEYQKIIKQNYLDFIFLITPETSEERINKLDELSSGFLYAVSSSSTTGSQINWVDVKLYLKKLQQMKLKNPILAGFGVSNKESFNHVCTYTNGAIVGSAFIKSLSNSNHSIHSKAKEFISKILD